MIVVESESASVYIHHLIIDHKLDKSITELPKNYLVIDLGGKYILKIFNLENRDQPPNKRKINTNITFLLKFLGYGIVNVSNQIILEFQVLLISLVVSSGRIYISNFI